jgi:SagB-type dehydrogenase family enzyme
VEIISPVSGTTFSTGDASLLAVLSTFAVPRTVDEGDAAAPIDEWIAAGILVDADSPELASVHHWDRAALALHASSRARKWRKNPVPATAPAVAARRSDHVVPLAHGRVSEGHNDLAVLLEARRSRRLWAPVAIEFQTFSDLFWLSARNRASEHTEYVSRPYPSGGRAYSLELYPVLAEGAVDTLSPGVYRYLPEAHALEVVAPFGDDARRILVVAGNTAAAAPPPVAIVITSRYARLSEQYGTLSYSLILKEVGCLFQTLYLAAESLGLAACALGKGTPAGLLARLCGTTDIEEPVVGEFAMGVAAD